MMAGMARGQGAYIALSKNIVIPPMKKRHPRLGLARGREYEAGAWYRTNLPSRRRHRFLSQMRQHLIMNCWQTGYRTLSI